MFQFSSTSVLVPRDLNSEPNVSRITKSQNRNKSMKKHSFLLKFDKDLKPCCFNSRFDLPPSCLTIEPVRIDLKDPFCTNSSKFSYFSSHSILDNSSTLHSDNFPAIRYIDNDNLISTATSVENLLASVDRREVVPVISSKMPTEVDFCNTLKELSSVSRIPSDDSDASSRIKKSECHLLSSLIQDILKDSSMGEAVDSDPTTVLNVENEAQTPRKNHTYNDIITLSPSALIRTEMLVDSLNPYLLEITDSLKMSSNTCISPFPDAIMNIEVHSDSIKTVLRPKSFDVLRNSNIKISTADFRSALDGALSEEENLSLDSDDDSTIILDEVKPTTNISIPLSPVSIKYSTPGLSNSHAPSTSISSVFSLLSESTTTKSKHSPIELPELDVPVETRADSFINTQTFQLCGTISDNVARITILDPIIDEINDSLALVSHEEVSRSFSLVESSRSVPPILSNEIIEGSGSTIQLSGHIPSVMMRSPIQVSSDVSLVSRVFSMNLERALSTSTSELRGVGHSSISSTSSTAAATALNDIESRRYMESLRVRLASGFLPSTIQHVLPDDLAILETSDPAPSSPAVSAIGVDESCLQHGAANSIGAEISYHADQMEVGEIPQLSSFFIPVWAPDRSSAADESALELENAPVEVQFDPNFAMVSQELFEPSVFTYHMKAAAFAALVAPLHALKAPWLVHYVEAVMAAPSTNEPGSSSWEDAGGGLLGFAPAVLGALSDEATFSRVILLIRTAINLLQQLLGALSMDQALVEDEKVREVLEEARSAMVALHVLVWVDRKDATPLIVALPDGSAGPNSRVTSQQLEYLTGVISSESYRASLGPWLSSLYTLQRLEDVRLQALLSGPKGMSDGHDSHNHDNNNDNGDDPSGFSDSDIDVDVNMDSSRGSASHRYSSTTGRGSCANTSKLDVHALPRARQNGNCSSTSEGKAASSTEAPRPSTGAVRRIGGGPVGASPSGGSGSGSGDDDDNNNNNNNKRGRRLSDYEAPPKKKEKEEQEDEEEKEKPTQSVPTSPDQLVIDVGSGPPVHFIRRRLSVVATSPSSNASASPSSSQISPGLTAPLRPAERVLSGGAGVGLKAVSSPEQRSSVSHSSVPSVLALEGGVSLSTAGSATGDAPPSHPLVESSLPSLSTSSSQLTSTSIPNESTNSTSPPYVDISNARGPTHQGPAEAPLPSVDHSSFKPGREFIREEEMRKGSFLENSDDEDFDWELNLIKRWTSEPDSNDNEAAIGDLVSSDVSSDENEYLNEISKKDSKKKRNTAVDDDPKSWKLESQGEKGIVIDSEQAKPVAAQSLPQPPQVEDESTSMDPVSFTSEPTSSDTSDGVPMTDEGLSVGPPMDASEEVDSKGELASPANVPKSEESSQPLSELDNAHAAAKAALAEEVAAIGSPLNLLQEFEVIERALERKVSEILAKSPAPQLPSEKVTVPEPLPPREEEEGFFSEVPSLAEKVIAERLFNDVDDSFTPSSDILDRYNAYVAAKADPTIATADHVLGRQEALVTTTPSHSKSFFGSFFRSSSRLEVKNEPVSRLRTIRHQWTPVLSERLLKVYSLPPLPTGDICSPSSPSPSKQEEQDFNRPGSLMVFKEVSDSPLFNPVVSADLPLGIDMLLDENLAVSVIDMSTVRLYNTKLINGIRRLFIEAPELQSFSHLHFIIIGRDDRRNSRVKSFAASSLHNTISSSAVSEDNLEEIDFYANRPHLNYYRESQDDLNEEEELDIFERKLNGFFEVMTRDRKKQPFTYTIAVVPPTPGALGHYLTTYALQHAADRLKIVAESSRPIEYLERMRILASDLFDTIVDTTEAVLDGRLVRKAERSWPKGVDYGSFIYFNLHGSSTCYFTPHKSRESPTETKQDDDPVSHNLVSQFDDSAVVQGDLNAVEPELQTPEKKLEEEDFDLEAETRRHPQEDSVSQMKPSTPYTPQSKSPKEVNNMRLIISPETPLIDDALISSPSQRITSNDRYHRIKIFKLIPSNLIKFPPHFLNPLRIRSLPHNPSHFDAFFEDLFRRGYVDEIVWSHVPSWLLEADLKSMKEYLRFLK